MALATVGPQSATSTSPRDALQAVNEPVATSKHQRPILPADREPSIRRFDVSGVADDLPSTRAFVCS